MTRWRHSGVEMSAGAHTMADDELWNAVAGRDAQFDGLLFYGVVTTGVYCRPSCPSRRPNRDNTRYFGTPTEAERAGLRPCRRCRPDAIAQPIGAAAHVAAVCRRVLADCDVTLVAVAREMGLAERTLRRSFAEVLGVSPSEFIASAKVERLKRGLRRHGRVTDAAYAAGYGSSSRLYEGAGAKLGMSPGELAAGAAGQVIRYAIEATCRDGSVWPRPTEAYALRTLARMRRPSRWHCGWRFQARSCARPLRMNGSGRCSISPNRRPCGATCPSMCVAARFRRRCGRR
ncbi:MAG: methylphosphotriester-DNA--protein-cysteine methyltransferase family protein [Gammaproteobacteria bacterium]|nr:methylphosphotriester-DNA--protein-cysteine methyltransferase family protein [Gammaproteobacteria bacterium]